VQNLFPKIHCVQFWLNLVGFLDSGRNLTFFFKKGVFGRFTSISGDTNCRHAWHTVHHTANWRGSKAAAWPDAVPPQHQPRAAAGIANLLATWREGLTLTVLTSGGG